MATLTLTVLRCPDSVTTEQRSLTGGELTLGRGHECGWPLPDPLKSLSRKHCTLEFFAGSWQVRDLSANGTYINFSNDPVGRDRTHPLRDGDRLRLGDYEIEARIDAPMETIAVPAARPAMAMPLPGAARPGFAGARLPGLDGPVDAPDPFGAAPPFGAASPFEPVMRDHAPASAEAFVPPPALPAAKPIIPDDWWRQPEEPPARAAPQAPAPAAAAVAPELSPLSPFSAPAPAPAPAPVQAPPAFVAAVAPAGEATGDLMAAVSALLAGGDLPPETALRAAADPQATLTNAGAMLRAAVTGIRALLIARGAVKREFRIEQTMLQPRDNNPLKFAASDEQALAALLDPRTPALRAVDDAIKDLTLHQVATLAATQAAARALLERLGPDDIEAQDSGGGLLPGTREKRLWEAYKRRHAKFLEQFEDDFESAFGTAFARAYEEAARRARG